MSKGENLSGIGVRKLEPWPRFAVWALSQSIMHPRTPLRYYYCTECGVRLHPDATECPVCGKKKGNSPTMVTQSQIPWWGSVAVILVGIICWCVGAKFAVTGLDEAGRALVYVPLGSLFGLSIKGA